MEVCVVVFFWKPYCDVTYTDLKLIFFRHNGYSVYGIEYSALCVHIEFMWIEVCWDVIYSYVVGRILPDVPKKYTSYSVLCIAGRQSVTSQKDF